jgi:AmmeMemoRadiSam system protein B
MKTLSVLITIISFQNAMAQIKLRGLVDTIGFAHKAEQMDKVMQRINELQPVKEDVKSSPYRVAISPHDDYTYVGNLYPALLKNVKAKTIILFGVAHKAKNLHLENLLVFDSYTHWRGPYGNVKVSSMREDIINELPKSMYEVNDSMQGIEHSVEANRDVEIVSLLVPFMSYERMQELAKPLAEAISKAAIKKGWEWGKDYAIVISTDAVHYGDEDWGGKNYAKFGADTSGYEQAVSYEHTIINECLKDEVKPSRLKTFTEYTVQKESFRDYKWTWCGRYSVPCGLLTSYYLQHELKVEPLKGELVGYGTSIDGRKHIPVDDLGMGITAPAKLRHWVGYASIGYY